jgi:hypothetical protein
MTEKRPDYKLQFRMASFFISINDQVVNGGIFGLR